MESIELTMMKEEDLKNKVSDNTLRSKAIVNFLAMKLKHLTEAARKPLLLPYG